jgi:hypothetical protein
MIRLRLPVEAHQFNVDPMAELYRMLGYNVDESGGTIYVGIPSGVPPSDLAQVQAHFRDGDTTLELDFRSYRLFLSKGQYLLKIGSAFTVVNGAAFDEFLVMSEW